MLAVCRSSLLNLISFATMLPEASGTPLMLTLRPGIRLAQDICSFRMPRPFGDCTLVSSVSVTVWVVPSPARTVMLSAERLIINPLIVLLSSVNPEVTDRQAKIRVRAKVHTLVLFIAISLLGDLHVKVREPSAAGY